MPKNAAMAKTNKENKMLKLNYTDKADIPEGADKFYTESDGGFVLNADLPNTTVLESTLEKERKARRDAEAKTKDYEAKFSHLPDDFDDTAYKALIDGASGSKELEKALKEQRESIEKVKSQDIAKIQAELEGAQSLVNTHVKQAQLHRAMTEANISKEFIPAVEAMMSQKIKVEGADVFLNEKPVAEAMKDWAVSDEGKHFVRAAANSGGGATPSIGNAVSRDNKASLGGDKASRVNALNNKYPELKTQQ